MKNFKGRSKQRGFLGIAALVIGAVGTVASYSAQSKAADAQQQQAAAQREANVANDRAAKVQQQRDRLRQVREARIARARVISQASQSGVGEGTSGLVGGLGSISSQFGANIGAINVAQTFADEASAANQKAADFGAQANQFSAEAGGWQALSGLAFGASNQFGGWQKILGTEVKQAGK
jgi:hypothetical protein